MSTAKPTQEGRRGRQASAVTEIPAAGWKDIAWRTYTEVNNDHVLLVAAGVTFYTLLALVPALTALVSIYGLFADPQSLEQQMNMLQGVVPDEALQIIG